MSHHHSVVCDKCGATLYSLGIAKEWLEIKECALPGTMNRLSLDICPICRPKLVDWIKGETNVR